jgi:hypothetical protein
MFEVAPGVGWLFAAYGIGTIFGLWLNFQKAVEITIDSLIENGYLKHRKDANGEIEILKINEE